MYRNEGRAPETSGWRANRSTENTFLIGKVFLKMEGSHKNDDTCQDEGRGDPE